LVFSLKISKEIQNTQKLIPRAPFADNFFLFLCNATEWLGEFTSFFLKNKAAPEIGAAL